MTVSNEVYRHDFAGNGETKKFTIEFYFLVNAHIKAILYNSVTEVETELRLTTHYTLTGAGNVNGGELTMLTAPTSDESLTILYGIALKQELHYVEGTSFPAKDHETALDKLTMLIKQIQEQLDRIMIQAESYPGNLELPMPIEDYFLRWTSGELVNFNITDLSLYTISDYAETLLDDLTAAAARATLEALPGKQSYFIDATETDQGVTGDGKTIKAYVDVIGSTKKATLVCTHSSTENETEYTVTTNVAIPSNISLVKENGVVFGGGGTLTVVDSPNYGDRGIEMGGLILIRGESGGEVSDAGAVLIVQKYSSADATSKSDAAGFFSAFKSGKSDNARVQAIFCEAVDTDGSDNRASGAFVEGGRFHGLVKAAATNGSGYGLIASGMAEISVDWTYLIGVEGEVINKTGDAPISGSFDKTSYAAAFVATSSGTKKADAGFVVNPYIEAVAIFRTGFLVAEDSVDDAAFANRAAVVAGLDLTDGSCSWAAIKLGNNEPIRVKDNAGSNDLNMFVVNASDQLVLGTDAVNILMNVDGAVKTVSVGAEDSGGEGYKLLRVPN